jgi:hypothetical protein
MRSRGQAHHREPVDQLLEMATVSAARYARVHDELVSALKSFIALAS